MASTKNEKELLGETDTKTFAKTFGKTGVKTDEKTGEKTLVEIGVKNSSVKAKTPIVKKKRPGRPRKTPLREPRPRNGIVNNPKDVKNFIEFLYDKPLIFKKLWQYNLFLQEQHQTMVQVII